MLRAGIVHVAKLDLVGARLGTCGSEDVKAFSTIVADSVPPMQYLPPLTERVTLTDWMSDLPRTVVFESLVSVTRTVGC